MEQRWEKKSYQGKQISDFVLFVSFCWTASFSTDFLQFRLHLPEADDEGVEDAVKAGDPEAVPEFFAEMAMFADRELRGAKIKVRVAVPREKPEQQGRRP